ncbi:MAG: YraN family protein [Cyclobacteriaceae bacterium]
MNKRQLLGKLGERLAKQFYLGKHFEILSCNYRHRRNEIDLIVKKKDLLVFVEVKTRSSISFGYPEEMVSHRQRAGIVKAAEEYIYINDWKGRIRFDIISILKRGGSTTLKHFEDVLY